MSGEALSSNIKEIIEGWKKRPAFMETALRYGLRDGLNEFERQRLTKGQLSGRKSDRYGLNVGEGNARISLYVRMSYEGGQDVGRIAPAMNAWYLKVHQHFKFDGYIRPKNAGALAVPIHPDAKGRKPRSFSDLVFIKRAGKPPLLIRKVEKGKNKKISREDIMYVLKKQVYIPKRLYFFEEFATYGREMITKNIMSRLKEAANAN